MIRVRGAGVYRRALTDSAARSHIGANVWDSAVRKGARLSFEDAIDDALDQPRL